MSIKLEKHAILRGEHLPNLLEYLNGTRLKWDKSRGYSSAFAEKHDEILKGIIENPKKKVKIVTGLDDVCNCGVCPNKGEDCQSVKIREKCKSVASRYGIMIDGEYYSEELIKLLRKTEAKKE